MIEWIIDEEPPHSGNYDDSSIEVTVRYIKDETMQYGWGYTDWDGDNTYWAIFDLFGKAVKAPYKFMGYKI